MLIKLSGLEGLPPYSSMSRTGIKKKSIKEKKSVILPLRRGGQKNLGNNINGWYILKNIEPLINRSRGNVSLYFRGKMAELGVEGQDSHIMRKMHTNAKKKTEAGMFGSAGSDYL